MGKNEDVQRNKCAIQAILDDLEREGLIATNGKYRRARSGQLEPVYVATPKARECLHPLAVVSNQVER
jgi:hypothetical protein